MTAAVDLTDEQAETLRRCASKPDVVEYVATVQVNRAIGRLPLLKVILGKLSFTAATERIGAT